MMDHDNVQPSGETGEPPLLFCILGLYHFLKEPQTQDALRRLKHEIEAFLRPRLTLGTILLAPEGINGTICFPTLHKEAILTHLETFFPKLQMNISHHPTDNVFFRLKVRIKAEIVKMGFGTAIQPSQRVGEYVASVEEWNELIQDSDCWVIDTRNQYEIDVGTFSRAENPGTQSFTEFPSWFTQQWSNKKRRPCKKIAMFCTGGIRCEKATSFCLDFFKEQSSKAQTIGENAVTTPQVYHLKGGILGYLNRVSSDQSRFEGECYVFDRRTAVGLGVQPSKTYTLCRACRHPLSPEDRTHADYVEGIACAVCCISRHDKRQRYADRHRQMITCDDHLRDSKTVALLKKRPELCVQNAQSS